HPPLARALRARARRWLRRWTPADGLVDPDALAREALVRHQIGARSFSPTGLQHFAVCPYRFLLQAIHRLEPREEPVAIEILDPLTRGALFHDVQFEVLSELRAAGLLPFRAGDVERALATLDRVLARAADGVIIGGGQILQPVLYALVLEQMVREPVEGGRLYYCTADGGFQERVVPLDGESRASAGTVLEVVGRALVDGFLPAAPAA